MKKLMIAAAMLGCSTPTTPFTLKVSIRGAGRERFISPAILVSIRQLAEEATECLYETPDATLAIRIAPLYGGEMNEFRLAK
jgi:hypothetical protein